jgi:hypothetical protein
VAKSAFPLATTSPQLKTDSKRDRLVFLLNPFGILMGHANIKMHFGNGWARDDPTRQWDLLLITRHQYPLDSSSYLLTSSFCPQKNILFSNRTQNHPMFTVFFEKTRAPKRPKSALKQPPKAQNHPQNNLEMTIPNSIFPPNSPGLPGVAPVVSRQTFCLAYTPTP